MHLKSRCTNHSFICPVFSVFITIFKNRSVVFSSNRKDYELILNVSVLIRLVEVEVEVVIVVLVLDYLPGVQPVDYTSVCSWFAGG